MYIITQRAEGEILSFTSFIKYVSEEGAEGGCCNFSLLELIGDLYNAGTKIPCPYQKLRFEILSVESSQIDFECSNKS
jgi:hypothetical protein